MDARRRQYRRARAKMVSRFYVVHMYILYIDQRKTGHEVTKDSPGDPQLCPNPLIYCQGWINNQREGLCG
jgi:hypothetical protein